MTRTFVHYFGEEQVSDLEEALDVLAIDFEQRAPHIRQDTAIEGRERVEAVRLAIHRLGDRVAE